MKRRRHSWISRYPIPERFARPPCKRCGQPSLPGLTICEQCDRDEAKAAQSHYTKGQS